jgi:hypothetical protein
MKKNLSLTFRKIEKIALLLVVFLLPFQTQFILWQGTINGKESNYLSLNIYAIDILIAIFILSKIAKDFFGEINYFEKLKIFLIGNSKNSGKFMKNKLLFSYLAFIFLSLFSLFYATNKILTLEHIIWLILAGVLAWAISREKERISLLFVFLTGLFASCLIGVWQFLNQFAQSNKWLGIAEHNPKEGGSFVVEVPSAFGENLRWLRAYGTFDHPNIFGGAMTVGIFLTIYLLLEESKYFKKSKKLLLYIFLIFFSAGAFMSLSRTSWLGIILAAGIIFLVLIFKKQKKKVFKFLKLFSIILVIFFILSVLYSQQVFIRTNSIGRLEKKSLTERNLVFSQGKVIVENNILLGVGVGNYIEELKKNSPNDEGWNYQPVHNVFLLIWAEAGILGLFIVIAIILFLAALAWKNSIFLFALIISQLPAMFLDHWLFSLHFGIILVGFMFGLILNVNNNKLKIT